MTRSLTMNDYRAEVWTAQKPVEWSSFIVLVLVLVLALEDLGWWHGWDLWD